MAKLNAKNIGAIKDVAKKSDDKSQILSLKIIDNANLVDYPRNNEDVSQTEDLELSIKQNGFTDPIEVTDFNMENGKYMIVSGHRRRCAGVKCNMDKFPCIIRHFNNEQEVYNYVLLSNSQRDSVKDPLLYCRRYKMHEQYLRESGFKGSIINEVAKRIGLSSQQAERYDRFNRIISPCWDLVRDEKIGMSSLLPMAVLSEAEQNDIYNVVEKCIENGIEPTRDRCKKIIDRYKNGVRGYDELVREEPAVPVNNAMNPPMMGVSVMSDINTEPTETKEKTDEQDEPLRNNEVNYDASHREGVDDEADRYKDEKLTQEDLDAINKAIENEKKDKSEEEIRFEKGEKLQKTLSQSLIILGKGYYDFRNESEKDDFITLLGNIIEQGINELYDFSADEKINSKCVELLKRNNEMIEKICKGIQ